MNLKECDKRKKPYKQQTSYDLLIMLDNLLLGPTLHFTTHVDTSFPLI